MTIPEQLCRGNSQSIRVICFECIIYIMSQIIHENDDKQTQVLQFDLSDEKYCIDIHDITEITKKSSVTRIPNSEPEVLGVMDLRGNTTTIIDPKILFNIDDENNTEEQHIIVFDSINKGWIVDNVNEVSRVNKNEINTVLTENQDYLVGIIEIDDEFVVWSKHKK